MRPSRKKAPSGSPKPQGTGGNPAATFGEKLFVARQQAGLSQVALGERAGGLSKNAIYRLEAGDREPRLSTILRLAEAMNMKGSDLIKDLTAGD
jgi:transcriptional regulator with XRE-family HTH domain